MGVCGFRDWDSTLNQLKQQTLSALQEVLYDLARPFSSHYGAIIGLTALGAQVKSNGEFS